MTAYRLQSAQTGRTVTVCAPCLASKGLDERDRRVTHLAPGERVGRTCAGCQARLTSPARHGYPCWRCDETFDPLTTTGTVYCPACHPLYLEHRERERQERADRHADADRLPA